MSDEPRTRFIDCAGAKLRSEHPSAHPATKAAFPDGFEEDDDLRSEFVRQLARAALRPQKLASDRHAPRNADAAANSPIPRTLVRFWHDSQQIPADVQACLDSWAPLRGEGVTFRMFDDATAASYIAHHYGLSEVAAFARCEHPAMRSDYLRMCFVLAEGGLYVDADDELLDDRWRRVFRDNTLKLQPLCYDIPAAGMVAATEPDVFAHPNQCRIFYINNNPIAAPPGHPVLRRALARATRMLLDRTRPSDIQFTTGPGNLTAALAAHAHADLIAARHLSLELLFDWETTAKPNWNLGYRHDDRNWRNWDFASANRRGDDE